LIFLDVGVECKGFRVIRLVNIRWWNRGGRKKERGIIPTPLVGKINKRKKNLYYLKRERLATVRNKAGKITS